MSYKELTFDDYISNLLEIHNVTISNTLKNNILNNVILYGPVGVGKYTLCLSALQHLSPTGLKYYKKMYVPFEKSQYVLTMSDIHYEIDISRLCYTSTMLWHEIFQQILDSLSVSTPNVPKIIVCREFQEISRELLDVLYIYMQDSRVRFVFITTDVGFIPANITSLCAPIIGVPKPSKAKYTSLLRHTNKPRTTLPTVNLRFPSSTPGHIHICNTVISHIMDISKFDYLVFRTVIYELLVYNLSIHDSIWYILKTLLHKKAIPIDQVNEVIMETVSVLAKYNNNYHNIYHLEYFCCYLISVIHSTTTPLTISDARSCSP
jgi:hypothetical protein